jgi:flagellar motility protein MotE (MotC chaperone)/sporulation protein YlmC with PRC-barrel domain
MTSLNDLLNKPVRDPQGDEVARLEDLVVRIPPAEERASGNSAATATMTAAPAEVYPPVVGLVARVRAPRGSRNVFIPWEKVQRLDESGAQLNTPAVNLQRFAKREGEIVLRGGLFDRQVVDVEGRRIVRINDLDLAERNGEWRLMAVDVSFGAMVRQLPAGKLLSQRIASLLGREPGAKAPLIDWAMVVPVTEAGIGSALKLRIPRERLNVLHPADLAELMDQLTPQQSADLLENMDEELAADTLEEMEDERQAQILRAMDPERAADVLEEMEPDEATDALQGVSEEEAADLLGRMDREDAEEVQELLGYPEDSAGGIMTTDYLSVPDWATIGEIIEAMRARARAAVADEEDPLPSALPEIYVVEAPSQPPDRVLARKLGARPRGRPGPRAAAAVVPTDRGAVELEAEGRLVGVVELRRFLLVEPETPVRDVMRPPTSVAHPYDNERDVARLIADEDLVALPIVDDGGAMLGIVTVDDAIDVILPTAWKKRIPRRFR